MLAAYNGRISFLIPEDTALDPLGIEDNLESVLEVLEPRLIFINFGSETVELTITRTVNLGVSADPEDTGSVTETLVDGHALASGDSYTYTPNFHSLVVSETTPSITHYAAFDGTGTTTDNVVQLFVSGWVEETTRSNLLNYTRPA